jgi:hypothetical protein
MIISDWLIGTPHASRFHSVLQEATPNEHVHDPHSDRHAAPAPAGSRPLGSVVSIQNKASP